MAETLSPVLSDVTEHKVTEILKQLAERRWTLAMAESCTGGLLSSLFTDVPGYSHVFVAGYVTYSNAAKARMLGISPRLIDAKGAVSEEVARAMAEGARDHAGADIALSVTGFAGPGAPGADVGLVHFACARRDAPTVHEECHFGDRGRGDARLMCIRAATALLHRSLSGLPAA